MIPNRHTAIAVLAIACAFVGYSSFQDPPDVKLATDIFTRGERLYEQGKYKQAADTLKVSTAIFEQFKKTVEQVRSANLQAECLSNLGQCDIAGALLHNSLEIINRTGNRAVIADTYYYLSRHAGGCARKYDDAIRLMRQSLAIRNELYEKDDPSLAFNYTFLGYIYNSKGKYDSALIYLDEAMAIRTKHLQAGNIETSHTMFNLAASYEGKSELGKALAVNLEALKIRTKALGTSHATVSNSINSIGRIYRKLGNNERALEYYRQALEIRKNTLGLNHPNVAASYYEIGNLYGNISNYHSSLEYVREGNRILESNTQVASDVLPTYIAYAGKMYGLIGDHANAEAHIQKAIKLVEKALPPTHPYRAIVYNIAGEYYGDAQDVDKQEEFFKKSIAIYQSSYGTGSEREADIVAKKASTYAKLSYWSRALDAYKSALSMYTKKLSTQNPKVATMYIGMAGTYEHLDSYVEAKKAYEQAAASISDTENKPLDVKILRGLAKATWAESPENSIEYSRRALNLINEIGQGYNNEAARIQLEKEKREICDAAMEVVWDAYHRSPGDLEDAFFIIENSKATLLLENVNDQQAKTIAGVPDSVIAKERDLRIELEYYKTSFYQLQKTRDTAATTVAQKNIFDSERKLEEIRSQLENDFPAYYNLKYHDRVKLRDLQQQLPEPTSVLQYFVGKKWIYSLLISHYEAKLIRHPRDFVEEYITGYQKSLTDLEFIMNNPSGADSLYLTTAHKLFDLLLLPDPMRDAAKKLVIIPDDLLGQMNFGPLLYQDVNSNDYTKLPYISSRYTVSYAYSAAFVMDNFRGYDSRSANFAGFAPSYELAGYSAIDSTAHPMTALAMRSGNLPLPGAAKEVNLITTLMQGRSWLDEEATETNFKKNARDYDILHLAMHSLLNDEEPRYSELLFSNRSDKENDGYLTIGEIYNLQLHAQLVVLSACSSGFGKIQHGEGPISLSRAFSYAGCPSVVMSLWKVPDLVTTSIMTNFYENLKQGVDKDEALRAAQQKFLRENTDPLYRHPYYWAGFVVIGDTSPIESSLSNRFYLIAGSFVLLAGVALAGTLIYKRRK